MRLINRLLSKVRTTFAGDASIDREIEDEFAEHLEERAAWFAEQGAEPNEARARAIEAFGDVEAARAMCRAEALQARIRSARRVSGLAAVASAACVVAALSFAVTSFLSASARAELADDVTALRSTVAGKDAAIRRANEDLQALRTTKERLERRLFAAESGQTSDDLQAFYTIRIEGKVRREGTWRQPRDQPLMLGELLSAIGFADDATGGVTLTQRLGTRTRTLQLDDVLSDPSQTTALALIGDCSIVVR